MQTAQDVQDSGTNMEKIASGGAVRGAAAGPKWSWPYIWHLSTALLT